MNVELIPVLGIDPGYASCGYGVVGLEGRTAVAYTWGCIRTTPRTGDLAYRLLTIHQSVEGLIHTFQPGCISIEKLFFSRNTTTALQVSEARGVILLAAAEHNIPVYEYTPKQVKLAITGTGSADKMQMQQMISRLLRLSEIPRPDDAADGLSLALCHMHWRQD
ncbi:MAG: crossover junction endodeoxyribonuclease RuvC [Methanospirillum sp.]|nr:crossover junction endodeoxyribonuclease RuvC [Methanospirillum sp.]